MFTGFNAQTSGFKILMLCSEVDKWVYDPGFGVYGLGFETQE